MPEETNTPKQEVPIYDIEILGQKFNFPNSPYKLAAFILLIGAVIFLFCFIMANRYGIVQNSEGFSFTIIDKKAVISDGYTIAFWTPSDSTKVGLAGIEDCAFTLSFYAPPPSFFEVAATFSIYFVPSISRELKFFF